MYDLIIIGGGPAGLTAALYSGRSRLKTLLLEKTGLGGQIILSPTIENYPGFAGGVATVDLILAMQKQVEELEVEIKIDEAVRIDLQPGYFKVIGHEVEYQAKTIIVSAGACPKKLAIPGEGKLIAKGVSYCGTCDGPLFKNKDIFVVGGGDKAVEEAIFLTRFARKVTLIHRRDELRASKILQERILENKKVEILWNTIPLEVIGEKTVEAMRIKNLKSNAVSDVACSGIFVFVGIHPHTAFLGNLVKLDETGFILTNEDMEASISGIFAAGDCRKKTLTQVITACADGAIAAFNANRYLETRD
ncbi:MAG: thioredoxin-disulfide reductase [Omnitrophica WOR_2 bacterium RIFOXYB2_FULL_45_11]|nr:MAG: thioredoxin-disulfide reductase [Omnitrophica WOR_2 bacterium RIFOXYB2_FULL_45_11]